MLEHAISDQIAARGVRPELVENARVVYANLEARLLNQCCQRPRDPRRNPRRRLLSLLRAGESIRHTSRAARRDARRRPLRTQKSLHLGRPLRVVQVVLCCLARPREVRATTRTLTATPSPLAADTPAGAGAARGS